MAVGWLTGNETVMISTKIKKSDFKPCHCGGDIRLAVKKQYVKCCSCGFTSTDLRPQNWNCLGKINRYQALRIMQSQWQDLRNMNHLNYSQAAAKKARWLLIQIDKYVQIQIEGNRLCL